jgi:hypothetical protein
MSPAMVMPMVWERSSSKSMSRPSAGGLRWDNKGYVRNLAACPNDTPLTGWIERVTGWSIRKFVKTARRYRTIQIQASGHLITAADLCAHFGGSQVLSSLLTKFSSGMSLASAKEVIARRSARPAAPATLVRGQLLLVRSQEADHLTAGQVRNRQGEADPVHLVDLQQL